VPHVVDHADCCEVGQVDGGADHVFESVHELLGGMLVPGPDELYEVTNEELVG